MATVLITGIDGFTGRYLADALKKDGFNVVGLSNNIHSPSQGIFQCDLLDRERLNALVKQLAPDYVAHLAAISFVGHGNAEDFYRVNVIGSLNLLESLCQTGLKAPRVLIVSSANIYGTPDVEVIDESVIPAPVNHYATSKLAMECMVRTMFNRLSIVVTRPFNYTGIGQNEQFLIPKIVNHFRHQAKIIELGNLDVSRDFSDVRDVVAVYVALLKSDTQSAIVNICSGKAISLDEIIRMMNQIAGYQIEVKVSPAFVRNNEIKRLVGSNNLLRSQIDDLPFRALDLTLAWMYGA